MRQHLSRFLLSSKLHQRRDGIQRIEEKVRFQLHLKCPKLCRRELFLQLQSAHGIALRPDLKLNNARDTEDKSVEQYFHAKAIDVQHAGPYGKRRCISRG